MEAGRLVGAVAVGQLLSLAVEEVRLAGGAAEPQQEPAAVQQQEPAVQQQEPAAVPQQPTGILPGQNPGTSASPKPLQCHWACH